MASTINASSTANGIVSTADASGILNVQSNGVNTNAQAWARFSISGGTFTAGASYNISSITVPSTGQINVSFTNSLTDANYSVSGAAAVTSNAITLFNPFSNGSGTTTAPTASGFTASFMYDTGSGHLTSPNNCMFVVFR